MSANETVISSRNIATITLDAILPSHRGIWVGGAGNLAVTLADGRTVTINGIQAGTLLPLEATKVNTSGTTATNLLLWC
jgi:hypothetical protein